MRVARAIFGNANSIGRESIDGRERDCVIRTRDEILIVEATLEPKKEKTEYDAKKTHDLVTALRKINNIPVNGLLVVFHEPTDSQREIERKYKSTLRLVSFRDFLSRLMDGSQYLSNRMNYRFGSIIDPRTDSSVPKSLKYVEVPLVKINKERNELLPTSLAEGVISKSGRYVITGDFGVGKSMTLRHIFGILSDKYRKHETRSVPIYLNLRDHAGQRRPSETLRTHCEDIGFPFPNDIVNAWRAGYVTLILDGFDEISSPGWGRSLSKLREYRYSAMELIRTFVSETPTTSTIILAGRSNYFDTNAEMRRALAIDEEWNHFIVDELNSTHVEKLLSSLGAKHSVPDWLPARPLLLSYFASQSANQDVSGVLEAMTPAEGWDNFLDRISTRESTQRAIISADTVRLILNRLATYARREPDGLGRISTQEISKVFEDIAGYTPDDDAQGLLLRLPGLRPHASGDGTRSFIDSDFAGALKGGDIANYIIDPYGFADRDIFRLKTQSAH